MPKLSEAGNQLVQEFAARYGISSDGVTHMLIAVNNGNGSMAQFSHPDFGGSGQWMRGGMTMVSDLFNHQLKSRVDNLCNDISNALAANQTSPSSGSFQSQSQSGSSVQSQAASALGGSNALFEADRTTNWWPEELGPPAAVGAQNNVRYAYFPAARRLAVATGGDTWIYDTLEHQIGGFSQQQGLGGTIAFSSQFGTVNLGSLPVVSRGGVPVAPEPQQAVVSNAPDCQTPSADEMTTQQTALDGSSVNDTASPGVIGSGSGAQEDVLATLERLGALKEKGYVTDEEFASKKTELLARL